MPTPCSTSVSARAKPRRATAERGGERRNEMSMIRAAAAALAIAVLLGGVAGPARADPRRADQRDHGDQRDHRDQPICPPRSHYRRPPPPPAGATTYRPTFRRRRRWSMRRPLGRPLFSLFRNFADRRCLSPSGRHAAAAAPVPARDAARGRARALRRGGQEPADLLLELFDARLEAGSGPPRAAPGAARGTRLDPEPRGDGADQRLVTGE